MSGFVQDILSNGNGKKSSTRFAYFGIIIISILLALCCGFVMVYEVLKPTPIAIDFFTGIAAVLGSVGVLIASAGLPKALSDKWQKKNKITDES